jgi:predicted cupin superfamily sugar epimerase
MGDPVEMLLLLPDGTGRRVVLGCDLARGENPQVLVPAGCWQGSRLLPGGRLALMGTTMSPGFELGEYEHGNLSDLLESHPEWTELIRELSSPSPSSGAVGEVTGNEGKASS